MDNLQNGASSRQQFSIAPSLPLEDIEGFLPKQEKKSLEGLDPTSIAIIEVVEREGKVLGRDLMEVLHLSKAPILNRLKKLSEDGYLIRSAVPGTAHKPKPTYVYEVPSYLSIPNSKKDDGQEEGRKDSERTTIEIMAELLEAAIQEISELKIRISKLESILQAKPKLNHKELLSKLKS